MQRLFLLCEKCGADIEIAPLQTTQFRNVTCHNCDASLTFQNSELNVLESSATESSSHQ
jgi:hypothetical protein